MRQRALVAIGGIDLDSMPAVLQTGVGSVAVVRAITGAKDVVASVRQLQNCMSAA
jgi:thiamine-phosphate pyrophosphorylase